MSSKLFRPLLLACTLLFASGAQATQADPHAHAHHTAQYRSIEVHIGAYAPVDPDTARDQIPGERLWNTPRGVSAYLAPALVIEGDEIRSVRMSMLETPVVDFELTGVGAAKLQKLTEENVGKALGIVLDGELLSVATINGPFGPQFQISAISVEHAKSLVDDLKAAPAD